MKKVRALLSILLSLALTAAILAVGMSTASAAEQMLMETDFSTGIPGGIKMNNWDATYLNPDVSWEDHENPGIKLVPVTNDGNGDLFCYETEGRSDGGHGPAFTGDKNSFLKPIFDNPADTCTVSFDVKSTMAIDYQINITLTDSINWTVNEWLKVGSVQPGVIGDWVTVSATFTLDSLTARLPNPATQAELINSLNLGLGTEGGVFGDFKVDNMYLKIDTGTVVDPPDDPTDPDKLPVDTGFEDGLEDAFVPREWSSTVLAIATDRANSGLNSLKVSGREGNWDSLRISAETCSEMVTNLDQDYTISAYFNLTAATNIEIRLVANGDFNNNAFWLTAKENVAAGEWTRLSVTFNPKDIFEENNVTTVTEVAMVLRADGDCDYYVDDVQLYAGAALPPLDRQLEDGSPVLDFTAASIRATLDASGDQGLRFLFEMDKGTINLDGTPLTYVNRGVLTMLDSKKGSVAGVGLEQKMVLDNVADGALKDVPGKNTYLYGDPGHEFYTLLITGIPIASEGTVILARGYVIFKTAEGKRVVLYTKPCSASVSLVRSLEP